MSAPMWRALGVVAALALTAGLVALSRGGYATGHGSDALLRLSWSARPERVERCRRLTDEELAERPAHMRQRLECEGTSARYAVRVRTDGRVASMDTVAGGGLRGDRQIHFLREYRLDPGARTIGIEVVRVDSVDVDAAEADAGEETDELREVELDRGAREQAERRRQRQEALPARLALDTTVTAEEGRVVLVTYDRGGRRLIAVGEERE